MEHDEKTPVLVRRVFAYPLQLLLLEGEFDTRTNPCVIVLPAGTGIVLQLLLRIKRLE
jgi:hypothetical protein